MIFGFSNSEVHKTIRRLAQLGLTPSTSTRPTSFEPLTAFALASVSRQEKLSILLSVLQTRQAGTELLLKYTVLVHLIIQEKQGRWKQGEIGEVLSALLIACQHKQKGQEQKEWGQEKGRKNRSKSVQAETNVWKEGIISSILKSYLGYLMRLINAREDELPVGHLVEVHDAWKIVNLLRMIAQTTISFTTIGRYFKEAYGHLVVLLTRTLARDIYSYVSTLRAFIENEGCRVLRGEEVDSIVETVDLLQEFTKIEDCLLKMYLGKYFFQEVKDLKEPLWLSSNEGRFDALFKMYHLVERRREG